MLNYTECSKPLGWLMFKRYTLECFDPKGTNSNIILDFLNALKCVLVVRGSLLEDFRNRRGT